MGIIHFFSTTLFPGLLFIVHGSYGYNYIVSMRKYDFGVPVVEQSMKLSKWMICPILTGCRSRPKADRYFIMEASAACLWSIGSMGRLIIKCNTTLCLYLLRESSRPSPLRDTLIYDVERYVLSDLNSSILVLQAGYMMARRHECTLINTPGSKVRRPSWWALATE